MFRRLFGETESLQLQNLQKKVILTALGAALYLIGILLMAFHLEAPASIIASVGSVILMIVMFMWGFGAIKGLIGFGSIGAIFSGNVVLGVVIFVICAMLAYLISLVVVFLGIGRYIYLKVKESKQGGLE